MSNAVEQPNEPAHHAGLRGEVSVIKNGLAQGNPPPKKRGAIVGTAPTWRQTPWNDTTLDIFCLNDAYVLGIPRVTAWFDLHPIPEMSFHKGRSVSHLNAPVGSYLRPEGHLEWLKSRPFPVVLHDCEEAGCADIPKEKRTHDPYPFPNWPNAERFLFKALMKQYGNYVTSTPAWMLMRMLAQGYTEIHIYGIHLATEWEYIEQRPNMEFLIGMALARGVQFVIPEQSSLLKSKFVYALEHKPNLAQAHIERRIGIIKMRGQQLKARLAALPWYARGEKADLVSQLRVLELELLDARQAMGRVQALAAVS